MISVNFIKIFSDVPQVSILAMWDIVYGISLLAIKDRFLPWTLTSGPY